MNAHVDLDIADFVAGRLAEARRKEIEDHLKECDTCAAQAAWADEFRNQALRQGLRHLDPLRIVELSLRPVAGSEAEREHLASCDKCRAEVAWSAEHPTADAETEYDEPLADPSSATAARRRPLRLWWIAAAAVIAGALFLIPRGTRPDPSQFAIVEPLPVRISRSVPEPGSFEESRLLGLDAYASGNYGSAREHFIRAASIESDRSELLLYLGSAELLERDLAPAVAHLRQATKHAPDGPVRDEANWQLANALLLLGRLDEAERLLSTLANREGRRRDDSHAVLEAIDGTR